MASRIPPLHASAAADTRPSTSHLRRLEAESIFILRETAAELDKPVLLYSMGKDSSVLLHLSLKAFHPGKPPFPCCISIRLGNSAKCLIS